MQNCVSNCDLLIYANHGQAVKEYRRGDGDGDSCLVVIKVKRNGTKYFNNSGSISYIFKLTS